MSLFDRIRAGGCAPTRDALLADPRPLETLPPSLREHLSQCASCRELALALVFMTDVAPHLPAVEPPPGLVARTLDYIEPHWKPARRAVTRTEYRMIWGSALGLAGAAAVVALIVLESRSPLGQGIAAEGVLRIGVEIAGVQMIVGAILALVVLAIRAAQSSDSKPSPRPDRHPRGGND